MQCYYCGTTKPSHSPTSATRAPFGSRVWQVIHTIQMLTQESRFQSQVALHLSRSISSGLHPFQDHPVQANGCTNLFVCSLKFAIETCHSLAFVSKDALGEHGSKSNFSKVRPKSIRPNSGRIIQNLEHLSGDLVADRNFFRFPNLKLQIL